MIDLKNALPVVDGNDGFERADQFDLGSATPVDLENAYEEAKQSQEPASATLGGFLKGLISGESLPKDIQTYNIEFEEHLESNPSERKIAKALLLPTWEAIQSIKSGVVSYLNKEQLPDDPFALKDRSMLEVPAIKQTLTSPEYVGYLKESLKIGANLSFNTPTSSFFFLPNASKKAIVDRIDKMSPEEAASLTEVAGDMMALGAVEGSMGLLERYASTNSVANYKRTYASKINIEGKGYTKEEVASIKKVDSAIKKVVDEGSKNPFSDISKQRKRFELSPQEMNLWKGATSKEAEVAYGAGLPVPKEPTNPSKGKDIVGAITPTAKGGETEYIYHNSAERHLESIANEGLSKDYAGEYPHGMKERPDLDNKQMIYFSDVEGRSREFGDTKKPTLLRVRKSELKSSDYVDAPMYKNTETRYFGDNIYPDKLEIKVGDEWLPLREYVQDHLGIKLSKLSPKESAKGGEITVYRGDTSKIDLKDYDVEKGIKDGKELGGAFAEGPGIYFTTKESNAKGYGSNISQINIPKTANIITDESPLMSRASITKMLKDVDGETLDIAYSNWAENKTEAKKLLIDALMNAENPKEQLINIWADVFYHQQPNEFMSLMKKHGIDGIKVAKEGQDHYVIYNRDLLTSKLSPTTAKGGEIAQNIKFVRSGDAVGKEYHETIQAIDKKTGEVLGYVDYVYSDKQNFVKMIDVKPEYKRKGVGTALLNEMQSGAKKPAEMVGDYMTDEGKAFFSAYKSKLSTNGGGEETTDFYSGFPTKPGKDRGFVKSVEAAMPILKVAGQYIPRSTDVLAMKAKTLIKENLPLAQKMANEGMDEASVAVGAELLKHYMEEADKATSQVAKDAIYERATELANSMATRLTEAGRAVQAASILSRMTPEGQLRFASRLIQKYNEEIDKQNKEGGFVGSLKKKIPELTPEQSKNIIDLMKEIQGIPEGDAKALKFKKLQDMISDFIPSKMVDKLVTIWKAGLLTGIQTTGVNTLANTAFAITELIKDIPAVAVDIGLSKITGERTLAFTTEGILKGTKEGAEKGWRFLKTGYDERNVLAKYDYKRVNFGKGKLAKGLKSYTDLVFNVLGAQDQPFYYGAKMHSLYSQASAQAINKGLTGQAKQDFVDNLVMNPTDDMVLLAIQDALIAVFQNPTMLGDIAKAIQRIPGFGDFVLPFGKTPSAVATAIVKYTPVGAIDTLIRNAGEGKFNQRKFAQDLGRALTGTAALGLGAYLFNKGMLNLDSPKTEAERKLWELEGRKSNTIKLWGKWRQLQVLGPIGNVLLIGGQFAKGVKDTGSLTGAFAQGAFGSIKAFTEQTFLTSVSMIMDAVSDPEHQAERFAQSFVGSWVPTMIKNVAVATDKKARRVTNPIDAIIERLPILRQILEPKLDVFGRDIDRTNNFLETMADPTRPSKILTDPVVGEIRRLVNAGNQVHTSQLGKREGFASLSAKQNTEMWRDAGTAAYEQIYTYISDPNYEAIPDPVKVRRINKILDTAKSIARINAAIGRTMGLKGDERRKVVAQMIKDGLLNKENFDTYKRSR